jgi:hypothetical protein
MPGSWASGTFPRLTEHDYQVTSPQTRKYNCIAWAVADTDAKWWPDPLRIGKWPDNPPREETVEAFVRMFEFFGYARCADGNLEGGFEKVAIYAASQVGGRLIPLHAARQLPNGNWTSKIGDFEDIEHPAVDLLDSAAYGSVVCYLRRPIGIRV